MTVIDRFFLGIGHQQQSTISFVVIMWLRNDFSIRVDRRLFHSDSVTVAECEVEEVLLCVVVVAGGVCGTHLHENTRIPPSHLDVSRVSQTYVDIVTNNIMMPSL